MFTRFSVETRNRFAKIVNVGMLVSLVSSLVTFAPMVPVQAASIALKSFSTTMSRPIFSSTSNAQFAWKLGTAITVGGGADCVLSNAVAHAGGCAEFLITLGSDSSTNPFWNTPTISDFAFTGLPAQAVVSSTVDITSSQATLYVDCSAACTFPADSAMTLTVVNNPIATPVAPGWVTQGLYATYPVSLVITDAVNVASMTSIIAFGTGLTVTASVDPTLTFSVTAEGPTAIKNETSDITPSDADTCNFGTLTPTVAKICAFGLHIATNASNGYSIYVVQDHNMTFNGNDIKQFNSGSIATYPGAAWAAPSSVQLAHLGYWSSDASVFNDAGAAPLWAGVPNIAAAGAAPVTTALVADASLPESNDYTYAIKIESAATLPQGTGYTHHEYFMVVGNF